MRMETNPPRLSAFWSLFYFFFRWSPFSAYDDHSMPSPFPTFIDALGTSLATSLFYGVCKANYSAFSSSFHDGADLRIFIDFLSLLSDRNFPGMDEKFAILWVGWTARPCGISVPQFQPFLSPTSQLSSFLPPSSWRSLFKFQDTPWAPNSSSPPFVDAVALRLPAFICHR